MFPLDRSALDSAGFDGEKGRAACFPGLDKGKYEQQMCTDYEWWIVFTALGFNQVCVLLMYNIGYYRRGTVIQAPLLGFGVT